MRKLIAFSGMLEKDLGTELNENARRDLDFIVDAAQRLQNLVEDLLALSRIGSAARQPTAVSLIDCARRALDALSMRVQETGAEIDVTALTDQPAVRGYGTLLTQLYQNLISNALKFVGDGAPPRIRLTCEVIDGERVYGVADAGIGIKPEHAEQIFSPFKRLHGRGEYEGTGIGLAICRKAVERHGGRIWAEPRPGTGSHFRFTLGLAEVDEQPR